jgi:hypothetical protein
VADDHRKSHVLDGSGSLGPHYFRISRTRPRKPNPFQFPEGALIVLYHFRDSVVAFRSIADSTVFFKKHQHQQRRESFASCDGAVGRKGKLC